MANNPVGITAKKDEDFSEWYSQLITKAELIDYTDVSGCYVLRPRAFALWEKITAFLDAKFKADGVKNASFPLFIPESYLKKEVAHVEGFSPEVAWVTHSGDTRLNEKLAIRPTSETIMYASYKNWIRSWRDLPLRLNQWCNVVRWEFSNPIPFLRSREFLWQEGHTVFATKEEADAECAKMLGIYEDTYEKLFAIPVLSGRKTDKEKFAGADYSLSCEIFLPAGKAIQGCTSHHLGQNFAKAFEISFKDKDDTEKRPFQNSWGFTTRSIGIFIMYHADDKGLVIPPRMATEKVVIVPILFDATKEQVLAKTNEIREQLQEFNPIYDDREEYSPGWKFNEWELKGIPLRIELGPRDLEKNQVMIARRDTGNKTPVPINELKNTIPKMLEEMQNDLLVKAKQFMQESMMECKTWDEAKTAVANKALVKCYWDGTKGTEESMKHETQGAKILNIPFEQPSMDGKQCIYSGKPAKHLVYFAKSY